MNEKRREPSNLWRGKQFHKLIQEEWLATSEGNPQPERTVDRVNGRKGRVDLFVDEIGKDFVSVVEIKTTDWDRIKDSNVRRNVKRQARQVWRYIQCQLELRNLSVCAGIIFPKLPINLALGERIESMFEEEGIQVVWHNESIDNVRERMRQKAQQSDRADC
jgi:hypothetical protein